MVALQVGILFAVAGLASAGEDALTYPTFDEYMKEHGLTYWEPELSERKQLYEKALKGIKEQNDKKGRTWEAGVNKLTVLKPHEMSTLYGYMKETGKKPTFGYRPMAKKDLPAHFDWRERRPSVVTAVKNQGSCGSCWAFAATAVMESAIAISTDTLFELSPQQLTSCTPNPKECGGAGGCMGATAQLAFNYTVRHGMTSLWTWPYTSGIWRSNGECYDMVGKKTSVAGITGYHQLPQNDAQALMEGVLVNPVSVSVAASYWGWYNKGIFDGCDTKRPIINHAVVLMGYGEEEGVHYWLVRNSWGPTWGEQGYIRLQRFPGEEPCGTDDEPLDGYSCKSNPPDSIRACGMCGILSDSAYPTGGFLGAPQAPDDPALKTEGGKDKATESVVSDVEQIPGGSVEASASVEAPRFLTAAPAAAAAAAASAAVAGISLLAWRRRGAAAAAAAYGEVLPADSGIAAA